MSNFFEPVIVSLTRFVISIPWIGVKFAKWREIEIDDFTDDYEVPWHTRIKEAALMFAASVPFLGPMILRRFGGPDWEIESSEKHELSLSERWEIFWRALPFTGNQQDQFREYDDSQTENQTFWQWAARLRSQVIAGTLNQFSHFSRTDEFSIEHHRYLGFSWIFYSIPLVAVIFLVGATLGMGNGSTEELESKQDLGSTKELLLQYEEVAARESLSTFERLDVLREKVSIAKKVMQDEEYFSQGVELFLDSNLETAIVCVAISARVPNRIREILEDRKLSINPRAEQLIEFSDLLFRIVDWRRSDPAGWAEIEQTLVEILETTQFQKRDQIKWAFLRHHSMDSSYFPQPNNFDELIREHLVISD